MSLTQHATTRASSAAATASAGADSGCLAAWLRRPSLACCDRRAAFRSYASNASRSPSCAADESNRQASRQTGQKAPRQGGMNEREERFRAERTGPSRPVALSFAPFPADSWRRCCGLHASGRRGRLAAATRFPELPEGACQRAIRRASQLVDAVRAHRGYGHAERDGKARALQGGGWFPPAILVVQLGRGCRRRSSHAVNGTLPRGGNSHACDRKEQGAGLACNCSAMPKNNPAVYFGGKRDPPSRLRHRPPLAVSSARARELAGWRAQPRVRGVADKALPRCRHSMSPRHLPRQQQEAGPTTLLPQRAPSCGDARSAAP
eukprot:363865-Chlamydomonas_euryale.AAC.21